MSYSAELRKSTEFDLMGNLKKFGHVFCHGNHKATIGLSTLDSRIDIGPTFINFGLFSRSYNLIREYIKVI